MEGTTNRKAEEYLQDFQLPLSGSLQYLTPPELFALVTLSTPSLGITGSPRGPWGRCGLPAFNSLSRDHMGRGIRVGARHNRLSTPSLGITSEGRGARAG